jgi:hypothetical protein
MMLPVAALAALALAGTASARTIEIRVGDSVDVTGTKLLCVAATSAGVKGIACVEANAKGAIPGTYGAALGEDGRVAVHRIDAKGEPQRIYRKLASRAGRYLKLSVGDAFHLKDTHVDCEIINLTTPAAYRGIKVTCYIGTNTGLKPSSLGITVSDRYAGVFRNGKNGTGSTDLFVRRQP